jgi:hypothetical protein
VGPAAYEPLSGRAKWAQRALIVIVVLNAIGALSAFAAYRLYQHDLVTQGELDSTDLREGLIAFISFLALIFTVVVFIRWFRRAYLNLPALGAHPLRFKSWWTIGGWFIPIANLFRPKEMANDIWRASEPGAPSQQGVRWYGGRVPALFQWWWAFFLIGNWLDNIGLRVDLAADDIDAYRRAAAVTMFTDSIDAVGAILAVLVVRRTTQRLESRAAHLAEAAD